MTKEKLLHLHLSDSMGNLKTLICTTDENGIYYSMYGGVGSSGMGFAVSNIQFYTIIDGNIKWLKYASLPIDTKLGETKEDFKKRVIDMLNHSTYDIVKIVEKPQFA